ncbi:type II toxin-antitoxin system VapB family antitoxin [Spirosoma montaniterrae]|uniref:Transcriptional regulator of the Arc/MetJ class n=1 Tax=Spirosoma montaniterrae TaxID=1178516 RepID=A0A1P9WWT9_9BACT|nr:type II toxin-antitoxin system VapB family antitoxin [Spirosoma montaniterrae]AQG79857.1 transcriptional regulator of the Arc/MetJ class [Spirosoma montaniterrae]
MRTNIDINDELLQEIMELTRIKTKREAVNLALDEFLKTLRRRDLLAMFGNVTWEGDLEQMRTVVRPEEWDDKP